MSITASTQEEARRVIEALPEGLNLGPPQTHAGLTIFPLSAARPVPKTRHVTLDRALAAGTFHVTEVSKAGSVPQLSVVNDGDAHVLLLDGEELVGAKQNRVLNVTVLAPAGRSIVVPVSCVEAGRWAQTGSREFSSADHVMYAAMRKVSASAVLASSKAGRGYCADQGKVWSGIAEKSRRLGSNSPTGAMRDMYRARGADIDRYVAAFTAGADQVGAAFCVGDRCAGVEVFDHPATLRALLPKLVRSYAMDAIEVEDDKREAPGVGRVEAFLRDIARANKEVRAGVGLGEDVRLSAPRLVGGALVLEGSIVHLSAFPLGPADETARPVENPDTAETAQPPAPRRSWLSSLTRRRNLRR